MCNIQRILVNGFTVTSMGEELHLLVYNEAQSAETLKVPKFRFCLLHADFLPGLVFNPEDGGVMFIPNVDSLSTDYTALYPRNSSSQPL
jgi:hypothetical protein